MLRADLETSAQSREEGEGEERRGNKWEMAWALNLQGTLPVPHTPKQGHIS